MSSGKERRHADTLPARVRSFHRWVWFIIVLTAIDIVLVLPWYLGSLGEYAREFPTEWYWVTHFYHLESIRIDFYWFVTGLTAPLAPSSVVMFVLILILFSCAAILRSTKRRRGLLTIERTVILLGFAIAFPLFTMLIQVPWI